MLSGRSLAKGLVAALLGLLLTTVGYAEATGIPRFYFGVNYLLDGIPLIPIVLGLFGFPELMELAVKNTSISRVTGTEDPGRGLVRGIRDAIKYRWLALRCALLGTYIGMLPGLGAAIVDWIAYGHAVQSASDKSRFGRGDIRGVIAPETANNSHKAGALIPTVAFGIPGSIGTAILLGALVIKGLRPGPDMLTVNLSLTFSMVWAIVVANVVAAALLMLFARHIHKIAFVPGHLIVPGVISVLLMGTWVATNSMGDWWICLAFGILGYWMKQGGWPRPPLILALVLGGLMENNFQLTTQIYGDWEWLYNRPIVVAIEILIVVTIVYAIRGRRPRGDVPEAGEGAKRNPLLSLPLAGGLLAAFAVAYGITRGFDQVATAQFPNAILITALPLAGWVLLRDVLAARGAVEGAGGLGKAVQAAAGKADLGQSLKFIGVILAVFVITYLVGQLVALPLFVAAYLLTWGGYGWRVALGYAAVVAVVLWAFYERLMGLLFHPSLIFG